MFFVGKTSFADLQICIRISVDLILFYNYSINNNKRYEIEKTYALHVLPNLVIIASAVNIFKNRFTQLWHSHICIINHKVNLTGNGNKNLANENKAINYFIDL